jgi:hypothetical protein
MLETAEGLAFRANQVAQLSLGIKKDKDYRSESGEASRRFAVRLNDPCKNASATSGRSSTLARVIHNSPFVK